MVYKKVTVTPSLKRFVECFYYWETSGVGETVVQSPPNGYCAFVCNCGDRYFAGQSGELLIQVPVSFFSGQFTSNYELKFQGHLAVVGIVFKPAALFSLFGFTMSSLVNSRVDAEWLLGDEGTRLTSAVRKAVTWQERISLLCDFLDTKLADSGESGAVDAAIRVIDEANGSVTIQEVADQIRVNKRTLEKKFLREVGISPKYYARIRRFGAISNKIAHSDCVDWQDMVFEGGFHDQSHLVKEFLEFNKTSPAVYHKTHREMTRFLRDDM
jgi:methylphosphotriester-DNA--protein-cysteine methyltransferase